MYTRTKHILPLFLLCIAVSAMALCASAKTVTGSCGDNLTYTLDTDTGELSITGTGEMMNWNERAPWFDFSFSIKTVKISSGVTRIGDYAFRDCNSLAGIIIPNSVTSIGQCAFSGCDSLTGITIPDSVTSIEEYAFSGCSSLASTKLPDSVASIGQHAFSGCSSLASITIPDSVTSIGAGAFYDCSSLTSITIPDSVTSIGEGAFRDCSSLTSITIPNSVTYIGDGAFDSTVIRCAAGSGAAAYARENGVPAVYINSAETADGRVVVKGLVDGAIADGAALTAATLDNSVVSAEVLKKLGREPVFKVLDIALESGGTTVKPSGRFTVVLTVEDATQSYKIYRLNDEGTLTDMEAVSDGGRLTFEAVDTGRYIVQACKDGGLVTSVPDETMVAANTSEALESAVETRSTAARPEAASGDSFYLLPLLICLLGIALLAIVILCVKHRKESGKNDK